MTESAKPPQRRLPPHCELLLSPVYLGLALILRILRLGTYLSEGELVWAFRAARFRQSLAGLAGDPAGTVTLWAASLGLSLRRSLPWPDLARLPSLDPTNLTHLRLAAPVWSTAALAAALATVLVILLLAFLAGRVWGSRAGLLTGLLLAISPYYLARSRSLGPDALTAGLAVGCVLALLWALREPRAWFPFVLSGALAGLAWLNQGEAIAVLPFALLLLAGVPVAQRRSTLLALRNGALWVAALAAGLLLAYPQTWIAPAGALRALLAQAASPWRNAAPGAPVDLLTLGLRMTPLSLAGLGLLVLRLPFDESRQRLPSLALPAFALLFWRLVPGGPADGHQALTAIVALDVAAAAGLDGLAMVAQQWLQRRGRWLRTALDGALGAVILSALVWQGSAVARYRPDYPLYRNPWLASRAPATAAGWGLGMDRVAAYLNTRPDAATLRVATPNMAALAPYFAGEILPLTEENRLTVDLVVLCDGAWLEPDPVVARVLREPPRHVIRLQGVECARIYANEIDPALIELLTQGARPDDVIVLDAPSPFAGHYRGPAPYEQISVTNAEQLAARLSEVAAGRWRLWHVSFEGADPENIARGLLETQAVLEARHELDGVTVSTYLLPLETDFDPLIADQAVNLTFPGSLRLESAGLAEARVQYRQKIALALAWQPEGKPPEGIAVSLRLVDEKGKRWAQIDESLADREGRPADAWAIGSHVTSVHTLPVPPGIPPGPYRVQVVFYGAGSRQPLIPCDDAGCRSSEVIDLLPLEVLPAQIPPAVEELSIPQPLQVPLAEGLRMLGCGIDAEQVDAGRSLPVRIWWQATAPVTETYQVHLMLVDAEGALRGERLVDLASAHYPARDWLEGTVLEERYSVPINQEAAAGEAILGVELVTPEGSASEPVRLGAVRVTAVERTFEPPEMQNPREETLGQAVRLLGYDLDRTGLKPGDTLRLTLYWQCLAPVDTGYTVFTHLLGEQDRLACGHDSVPAGGARPTDGWVLHEIVTDIHDILVPPGTVPGMYNIEVGLYDAKTGARLPAFDAAGERLKWDRILLRPVEVGS